MNLGAIVEVAIGIIFVWITLSLAVIQIQEWISTRLDKRARDMEASIHEMLANENLKAQFYDHPVIRGLTAKKRKQASRTPAWFYNHPLVRGFTKEKRKLPSYIPAQQFALTLFDIALTAGTESSLIQQGILKIRDGLEKEKKMSPNDAVIVELNLLAELARSAAATEAGTALTQKTLDILKVETEQFIEKFKAKHPNFKIDEDLELRLKQEIGTTLKEAERLKGEIDKVLKNQPKKDLRSSLGKVRRGIAALSVISPEVNQTLTALLLNVEDYVTEGETNLAKARKNVEKWFDDSMDRVSGTFKRYSQNMALIIGFIVALLLNVDSFNLTLYLWREPSVRAVLATKAREFDLSFSNQGSDGQIDPSQAMEDFREQFSGLNLPIGWTFKDQDDPIFKGLGCAWFPTENKFFGVPLYKIPGINRMTIYEFELKNKCLSPSQPERSTNILLKLIGIAITAIAARQGAPFWFDILKKAVNLRGTGANPVEKEGK